MLGPVQARRGSGVIPYGVLEMAGMQKIVVLLGLCAGESRLFKSACPHFFCHLEILGQLCNLD